VPPGPLGPLGPLPEVALGLAGVDAHSTTYDRAAARRDRTARDLQQARDTETAKDLEILVLGVREKELTTRIAESRARAERWEAEIVVLEDGLRELVISSYMSGSGDGIAPLLTLDVRAHAERATEDVTTGSLASRQLDDLERADRHARLARNDETISTAIREGVRDGLASATETRDQAVRDKARLAVELVEWTQTAEDERRLATIDGADFPLVVLDAYWKAAERMAFEAPGCGIPWWALAGIGKVESRHGTFAGSEVRPDGSLTKPIIGIPLTGAGGTAAIGDSDGGAIDGDPTVDRAAGPMQFIPQTWARWGRDGDGNGKVEIQNIYDAAAGAAAYLCASGPMRDDAGLQRGYFSYNHSLAYVATVLGFAKGYATSVAIPPV
jgi:membrane-bound lytic murein transglycosylase B